MNIYIVYYCCRQGKRLCLGKGSSVVNTGTPPARQTVWGICFDKVTGSENQRDQEGISVSHASALAGFEPTAQGKYTVKKKTM